VNVLSRTYCPVKSPFPGHSAEVLEDKLV